MKVERPIPLSLSQERGRRGPCIEGEKLRRRYRTHNFLEAYLVSLMKDSSRMFSVEEKNEVLLKKRRFLSGGLYLLCPVDDDDIEFMKYLTPPTTSCPFSNNEKSEVKLSVTIFRKVVVPLRGHWYYYYHYHYHLLLFPSPQAPSSGSSATTITSSRGTNKGRTFRSKIPRRGDWKVARLIGWKHATSAASDAWTQ